MNASIEVRGSSIHGQGVFATATIPAWTPILSCGDVMRAYEEPPNWAPAAERETSPDDEDPFQSLNHCCDPNAFIQSVGGTGYIFTCNRVTAGDEILLDYRLNATFDEEVRCQCGHETCTGTIQLDFFALPADVLVRRIPLLDGWFVAKYGPRLRRVVETYLSS